MVTAARAAKRDAAVRAAEENMVLLFVLSRKERGGMQQVQMMMRWLSEIGGFELAEIVVPNTLSQRNITSHK